MLCPTAGGFALCVHVYVQVYMYVCVAQIGMCLSKEFSFFSKDAPDRSRTACYDVEVDIVSI